MTQARVLKVLIASPGDLQEERELLVRTLGEWNALNAAEYSIVLLPVLWESHAFPELTLDGDPQGAINAQLAGHCDILIGMFWGRAGTPTGRYDSGTIEEIETFVDAGKPVMLYFSKALAQLRGISTTQLAKVERLRKQMQKRGLVFDFETLPEFREKVMRHLTHYARSQKVAESVSLINDPRVEKLRWDALPDEAKADLYKRFTALEPRHHLPLGLAAAPSVQARLQAHNPIRLDVLQGLLTAFGLDSSAVSLPTDNAGLLAVQDLDKPLARQIFEAAESGYSPVQAEAVGGLYDYLAAPDRGASSSDEEDCDVVLVPGARRGHAYRVDIALGIAQRSGAAIILSGSHPVYDVDQPLAIGEAEAMAYYLESKTLDRSIRVYRENRALTSSETLFHALPDLVRLAFEKGRALQVIVVTSPYHMRRMMHLWDHVYADRSHVVRQVTGLRSTSQYDRNVFFGPAFGSDARRYGIGIYVQELLKLYGGRVTGEF
ncbi:ElyC/SanA/YdcF family protein [Blastococcus sp. TBT05-19]|uniref:ElyC/SanA/YdcF family protein n=1 Tax=Blastococcus sp. TBT05-19 TaxID=2250581 RepID=UPI0013149C62|nr:ElyC/SanA/YdcF family protein [Blastococcus sp. TBT05-19]